MSTISYQQIVQARAFLPGIFPRLACSRTFGFNTCQCRSRIKTGI